MFLAEDRILCLEIFTKKDYKLKYLPNARCFFIILSIILIFYIINIYSNEKAAQMQSRILCN